MTWTKDTTPVRIHKILAGINRKQVELAQVLNVSPVTVSRWSTGRSVPDPRCREKLELLETRYVKEVV